VIRAVSEAAFVGLNCGIDVYRDGHYSMIAAAVGKAKHVVVITYSFLDEAQGRKPLRLAIRKCRTNARPERNCK
jgi:hypothetical protein